MKTPTNLLWAILLALFALPLASWAQDPPKYLVVTTFHADFDYDEGTMAEWLALEKEMHDKVTMKNEYIRGAQTMVHYYTADNSEVKYIRAYNTWADIEKAQDRSDELVEAGWPDEAERDAFFEKFDAYFERAHSDEIYHILPGAKPVTNPGPDPLIYVVQVLELANPSGGNNDEFMALRKEYLEKVTHKDPHLVGFYNERHGWGASSTDFIEVSVYKEWADIAKSNEAQGDLVEAAWPDEANRKAFFDKYNKYFTGKHGDYIYRNVPELRK